MKKSVKKKRKGPSAKKMLEKMKKADHDEHAQWIVLVKDDDGRLHSFPGCATISG